VQGCPRKGLYAPWWWKEGVRKVGLWDVLSYKMNPRNGNLKTKVLGTESTRDRAFAPSNKISFGPHVAHQFQVFRRHAEASNLGMTMLIRLVTHT
jgi:hypothetical protein